MRTNKVTLQGTELMTMIVLIELDMQVKLDLLTQYSYKPALKELYTRELTNLKAIHTKLKQSQLN